MRPCDKVTPSAKFSDCVINQMSKAGASADAVNFTRELYKQTGGEVGIIGASTRSARSTSPGCSIR